MKRRQFIQRSAVATLGLALPASLLKAQNRACSTFFQEHKWHSNKNDSYKITIDLCKNTVTAFENATAENKIFRLGINENIKNAQNTYDIKEYKAELRITGVKKMTDSFTGYKLETDFLQENKKEFELPKELNVKKLSLLYHGKNDLSTIDLLDKKGNVYLTLTEKAPVNTGSDDGDDDCFITTACTATLGKPDNCEELTTLRQFRDEVLKKDDAGKQLVAEYYHIAPGIVQAINQRPDRFDVYTNIYREMLAPTLQCISIHDHVNAIRIYKDYTFKLKALYGSN